MCLLKYLDTKTAFSNEAGSSSQCRSSFVTVVFKSVLVKRSVICVFLNRFLRRRFLNMHKDLFFLHFFFFFIWTTLLRNFHHHVMSLNSCGRDTPHTGKRNLSAFRILQERIEQQFSLISELRTTNGKLEADLELQKQAQLMLRKQVGREERCIVI